MSRRNHSIAPLAPDDPRHGTTKGYAYWRCHCDLCKATQGPNRVRAAARYRALRQLQLAHPDEFQTLYEQELSR